ncbi:hypothetical protein UT4_14600 [Ferrigenium sp. UT4]
MGAMKGRLAHRFLTSARGNDMEDFTRPRLEVARMPMCSKAWQVGLTPARDRPWLYGAYATTPHAQSGPHNLCRSLWVGF